MPSATGRDVPMHIVAEFSDRLDGRVIVDADIGSNGEALLLLIDQALAPDSADDDMRGWRRFHNVWNRDPYDATLVIHNGETSFEISLQGLTIRHPYMQLLPDDEVLLTFARCVRHRDGSVDNNATVFGFDGFFRRALVLGDGINSVQATRHGDVWVSYYDEGVFGNYGWGGSATSEPIGSSGIVLFDVEGNIRWKFSPPSGFDDMCDCYALNVTNGDAWAYYYTEFPLVRISRDRCVQGWDWGAGGFSNFATDGSRALFNGGYRKSWTNAMLVEIGESAVENATPCRLTLPGSGVPRKRAQVYGRGSLLHAFNDTAWYAIDVRLL